MLSWHLDTTVYFFVRRQMHLAMAWSCVATLDSGTFCISTSVGCEDIAVGPGLPRVPTQMLNVLCLLASHCRTAGDIDRS
jgi:hypothetical protein